MKIRPKGVNQNNKSYFELVLGDSSLSNASRLRAKSQQHYTSLASHIDLLEKQRNKHKRTKDLIQYKQGMERVLAKEIKNYYAMKAREQRSAVRIQAYFRGFMVRKNLDSRVISIKKANFEHNIWELSDFADQSRAKAGISIPQCATKLQRTVRAFLFRRKIERLRVCYLAHIEDIRTGLKNMIRKGLQILLNKVRVRQLAFERHRNKALLRIKRRLAVLVIKKHWKVCKLSFRVIKERLKRIRRKSLLPTFKSPGKFVLSSSKISVSSSESLSSNASIKNTEEYKQYKQYRTQRKNMKKLREQRKRLGRLAHGITHRKEMDIEPIMETYQDKLTMGTVSRTRQYNECRNKAQPTVRNTMIFQGLAYRSKIQTPMPPLVYIEKSDAFHYKRDLSFHKVNERAGFLKPTLSYKNYTERADQQTPKKGVYKIKNALKPTISTYIKKRYKRDLHLLKPWKNSSFSRNFKNNYSGSVEQIDSKPYSHISSYSLNF